MYAKLTDEMREKIVTEFKAYMTMTPDPKHAAAIVAHNLLCPSIKAWNGKKGSDAYAAVITVLVHKGVLNVSVAA